MKQQSSSKHESKKSSSAASKVATTAFSPQIKSKILAKWNKLASKDVDAMNGSTSMLAAKIQEVYNYTKAKAESECEEFKKVNMLRM